MSMQGRIGRAGGTKVKRALGVQGLLEWAFREQAQLELPVRRGIDEEGFGFGMEYVLIERARLGCKVDGGQHKMGSFTHADAEVIAASVAGMPDSLGGIRMAISVAEMARAGMTPDWMPGVVPRCVPMETKQNQHGERANTIVVGIERVKTRGKWRTIAYSGTSGHPFRSHQATFSDVFGRTQTLAILQRPRGRKKKVASIEN